MSKFIRVLGLGLAVFLLIGGWVYLYFKARDVDLRAQNEILGFLRQLKEIDNRWNDRLLGVRLADQVDARAASAPVSAAQLAIVQHKLSVQAQSLANPLLNQSLGALKEAFNSKTALVEQFLAANVQLTESLAGYNQTAVQGAARGSFAVARMSAVLANLLTHPSPETIKAGEAMVVELEGAGFRGAEVAQRAREIVIRKAGEERAFREAFFVSTGPRIDTLTRAFDGEFEGALQGAEIYRMYLLFYSGFLLAVLGLLGARLAGTYNVIRDMNRALLDANEGLEHRVAERTEALSHAMHQLKESESLLIQTEKMSSLGQMVAGVAHEVNTPLAYVKASLESVNGQMPKLTEMNQASEELLDHLQSEQPDEAQLAGQFERVRGLLSAFRSDQTLPELSSLVRDGLHGITQISDLVSNLRNFARLDRSKVAEFDLNQGIEGALTIARNLVKTRKVVRGLEAIPKVQCSPSQINQVFLNLINNAAQATSDRGGTITVRSGVKDNEHVFFEVEDNGHGIPDDVLPKIFDPFFTTKEIGQGTGLGLSIVYKIIEQHGGTVAVASQVGRGTRFVVTLPIRAPVLPEERTLAPA